MRKSCALRVTSYELWRNHCAAKTRASQVVTHKPRSGISLIEILIAMFVLLVGLMGVASIFPVGSHYMTEGEKFDFGSALAQNAFEELTARDILRPAVWLYGAIPNGATQQDFLSSHGYFNVPTTTDPADPHPGHAFVIDPLSVAGASFTAMALDEWPLEFNAGGSPSRRDNPWQNVKNPSYPTTATQLPGAWPARRITLPQAGATPLTTPVAETIFRLRDDLAVELPERDDLPSIQRWSTADPNNTPNDLTDDVLLARQYNGNYSWLATVVPASNEALLGLQPAHTNYGDYPYDVSVVVFYKRDFVPSMESERLIQAEILGPGEVAFYAADAQDVDDAVDDVRPGNWICLMGVDQTTGNFLMKWYRLLSLDDETHTEADANYEIASEPAADDFSLRFATIRGDDWPTRLNTNLYLRAAILPGAITVVTRQMMIAD